MTPNAIIFKINNLINEFQMYSIKGTSLVDGVTFTTDDNSTYNDLNDNQIAYIVLSFDKLSSKLIRTISIFKRDNITPVSIRAISFSELEAEIIDVLDSDEF